MAVRCEHWKLCREWDEHVKKINCFKDFPTPLDFCEHFKIHKKNKKCGHDCIYPTLMLGHFGRGIRIHPKCKRYSKLNELLEAL